VITIYTRKSPACPSCINAKALMNNRGIDYEEQVLGDDITTANFAIMYPGQRTVPYIIKDLGTDEEQVIGDYMALQNWVSKTKW
jgi:glutaredoxin